MFARAFHRIVQVAFVRSAVVRQKDDQGIVEQAAAAQIADDLPHARIHLLDHSGVDLHTHLLPLLLRLVGPVVALPVLRGQHGPGREDAHAFHPPETLRAQRIPARGEAALVFFDVFGACMQGVVRRGVGHIEEERGVLPGHFADEPPGMVGDRLRIIIVALGTDRGVAVEQAFGVPEAAVAAQRTVETLETALQGPLRGVARRIGVVGHMPFARHGRMVAARAERLGQRHGVRGQCAAVTRIAAVGDHVPTPARWGVRPVSILAREGQLRAVL